MALNSNKNESIFSKQEQENIELKLNSFEFKLKILEQNINQFYNETLSNKKLITVITGQLNQLNNTMENLNSTILSIKNNQTIDLKKKQLDETKPEIDTALNQSISTNYDLDLNNTSSKNHIVIKKVL